MHDGLTIRLKNADRSPLMSLPRRIPPVSGTCRWVNRRCRLLEINRVLYTYVRVRRRYRLVNWASGNVYDLDAAGRWCTCPSFVWFHCPVQAGGDGRCKHIAALRSLGLLPEPDPQPSCHQEHP
jgi:hypothetical protein